MQLAGCIIRNDKGEILLIHRNTPGLAQWELPGGKVDKHESNADAARREIREELGIDVTGLKPAGVATFQEKDIDYVYTWFIVDRVSGTPKPQEDKHDAVSFFAVSEIKGAGFSPNVELLVDAIKNKVVEL